MLTVDIKEGDRPYFLWDECLTWEQLQAILDNPSHPQFLYYLGKTLREADYGDIWKLVSVQSVLLHFNHILPFLGRKREFWQFLINGWKKLGLLPG